ncbi:MAG: MarR family transcriptional regulator [Erysipelotrichaceae bacterium]|nr:MarR family transcriptional regulator [Erysipelotrichaceae bacterium]
MEKVNNIGMLIHRIDNKTKAKIDIGMNRYKLTFSQSQVLFLLAINDGKLSQKKLQDLMRVSHPTMVGLIQRLEANEFVRTYTDEEDKRYKIVELTEQARAFGKEMRQIREDNEKAMLKGLSKEEKEILTDLLDRVYKNISEVETC